MLDKVGKEKDKLMTSNSQLKILIKWPKNLLKKQTQDLTQWVAELQGKLNSQSPDTTERLHFLPLQPNHFPKAPPPNAEHSKQLLPVNWLE